MNTKTDTSKLTDNLKLEIRNEFVQGIGDESNRKFYTLDELIKKHNVAQSTLYRVARDEKWKMQKDHFQSEYLSNLDKERTKTLSEESKKMDNNSINLAKALYQTVGQVIQSNNQAIQDGKKGLPPNQINALANAAIVAQRLAKLALGEATDNINANVQENDSFRRAMELLDAVEDSRSPGNSSTH